MGKSAESQSPTLEQFLASIYVDPLARARFLASPEAEASRAGLSAQQCMKLKDIDRIGLEMASRSFARKRASKQTPSASAASLRGFNFRNPRLFRFLAKLSRQD